MKKIIPVLVFIIIVIAGVFFFTQKREVPTNQNVSQNTIDLKLSNYTLENNPISAGGDPLSTYPAIYKNEGNQKTLVYRGKDNIYNKIIAETSRYPYMVLAYSCNNCDAGIYGNIIVNVENGKSIVLSGKEVLSIAIENKKAVLISFKYITDDTCELEFCIKEKVVGSESEFDLSSLN